LLRDLQQTFAEEIELAKTLASKGNTGKRGGSEWIFLEYMPLFFAVPELSGGSSGDSGSLSLGGLRQLGEDALIWKCR
jgi:hypothetical protein